MNQLSNMQLTIGMTAALRSCMLSLRMLSSALIKRVSVVRASLQADLPMDMKLLSEP